MAAGVVLILEANPSSGRGPLGISQIQTDLISSGLCTSASISVLDNAVAVETEADGPAGATAEIGCGLTNAAGGIDILSVFVFDDVYDRAAGEAPLLVQGAEVIGPNWIATVKSELVGGPGQTLEQVHKALGGTVRSA